MDKVIRKSMLYKTGVEYGDYTINPFIGCSHGCLYPCYAFMMAHRFGKAKDIIDWQDFKICDNALEILKKELKKLHNKIKSVQLCFSTDPFMYKKESVSEISIEIIKLVNSYNIPCYILTKGVLPKKLINLSKINYYGITYVSYIDEFQKKYEPNAAPLEERRLALKYLHDNGCNTWVSIEPYPTPNIIDQRLDILLEKISFVDKIIFGRLHYNKLVSQYKNFQEFYDAAVNSAILFCEKNSIEYHIKNKTLTKKN